MARLRAEEEYVEDLVSRDLSGILELAEEDITILSIDYDVWLDEVFGYPRPGEESGAARIPGYRVAGKTGTAQKAVPSGGYGEEHVASFVGYVPARRPALAMVVVLDSPQGLFHGGDVAAPVFARVALPALRHLGILPDEGAIDAPPARPEPILTVAAPRRAAPPLRRTGDGDPVVPDLAGATLRAALARLARAGRSARADGNGRVVGQDPPPGQVLPRGAMVRLLLKEPAPAANAAPGSPGRNGSRAGAR